MNYIKCLILYFYLSIMILSFWKLYLNTFNFSVFRFFSKNIPRCQCLSNVENKITKTKSSSNYLSGTPYLPFFFTNPWRNCLLHLPPPLLHYFSFASQPIWIQLLFPLIHYIDLAIVSTSSLSSLLFKSMDLPQSLTHLILLSSFLPLKSSSSLGFCNSKASWFSSYLYGHYLPNLLFVLS